MSDKERQSSPVAVEAEAAPGSPETRPAAATRTYGRAKASAPIDEEHDRLGYVGLTETSDSPLSSLPANRSIVGGAHDSARHINALGKKLSGAEGGDTAAPLALGGRLKVNGTSQSSDSSQDRSGTHDMLSSPSPLKRPGRESSGHRSADTTVTTVADQESSMDFDHKGNAASRESSQHSTSFVDRLARPERQQDSLGSSSALSSLPTDFSSFKPLASSSSLIVSPAQKRSRRSHSSFASHLRETQSSEEEKDELEEEERPTSALPSAAIKMNSRAGKMKSRTGEKAAVKASAAFPIAASLSSPSTRRDRSLTPGEQSDHERAGSPRPLEDVWDDSDHVDSPKHSAPKSTAKMPDARAKLAALVQRRRQAALEAEEEALSAPAANESRGQEMDDDAEVLASIPHVRSKANQTGHKTLTERIGFDDDEDEDMDLSVNELLDRAKKRSEADGAMQKKKARSKAHCSRRRSHSRSNQEDNEASKSANSENDELEEDEILNRHRGESQVTSGDSDGDEGFEGHELRQKARESRRQEKELRKAGGKPGKKSTQGRPKVRATHRLRLMPY